MLSPEEINTYGFPYVHGIPESIYRNLKMPETLSECNQMIRELKATKKDIVLQLRINKLSGKQDDVWEKSALGKLRVIQSEKRILVEYKKSFDVAYQEVSLDAANRLNTIEVKKG